MLYCERRATLRDQQEHAFQMSQVLTAYSCGPTRRRHVGSRWRSEKVQISCQRARASSRVHLELCHERRRHSTTGRPRSSSSALGQACSSHRTTSCTRSFVVRSIYSRPASCGVGRRRMAFRFGQRQRGGCLRRRVIANRNLSSCTWYVRFVLV